MKVLMVDEAANSDFVHGYQRGEGKEERFSNEGNPGGLNNQANHHQNGDLSVDPLQIYLNTLSPDESLQSFVSFLTFT